MLFQEFSKEVEGKSSLKSSVVTEGNQLLRLKKVDTVVLRSDLARIDTQWTELLTRIPVVQEKLHQVSGCFQDSQELSLFSAALLVKRRFATIRVFNTLIRWTQFQIQMEKLASRHAISELFNWISLMENVIEEDEENLKSAVGSNVIQDYLQKYKVFMQIF